ncbi:MAG: Zn-ribbon domain-containing OB-fold protein [Deltaproteobacteria bacterium]|nr:Zn-ribbon domain-containing OB-fold protein [Deltaproteobacteria bacterium]
MPYTSFMLLDRQKRENLNFHGNKCKSCGWVFFPKSRVCPECGAKDDFEDIALARKGKVFTYTKEYLYPVPETPMVMAVIDLDGGGRFFTHITDCDPDQIAIGLPVELTLRMFHKSDGFYNYSWKGRPATQEEGS